MTSNDGPHYSEASIALVLVAAWATACASVWALAGDIVAVAVGRVAHGDLAGMAALSFEDALQGLCAAVLVGSLGWLLVTGTIAVVAHLCHEVAPHRRSVRLLCRVNERTCPSSVRRFVAGALGAALSTGLATVPADAAVPSRGDRPAPASTGQTGPTGVAGLTAPTAHTGLTGLSVPDRATDARPPGASGRPGQPARSGRTARPPRAAAPTSVVVQPGECLWSIAVDLLTHPVADQRPRQRATGATAGRGRPPYDRPTGRPAHQPIDRPTDQEVTAAWHRLHRANAERIGPDPDLVLPGTRLVVPELTVSH